MFPIDIGWNLGTFSNMVQDGTNIRPSLNSTNGISAFLFNGGITDSFGKRTLAQSGAVNYVSGIDGNAVYLESSGSLQVDDATKYSPPVYHFISIYPVALSSDPKPIIEADGYVLEVYTGTLRLRVQTASGEVSLTTGISEANWYKIYFYITATEIGLNKDGNLQTASISSPSPVTSLKLKGACNCYIDSWLSYSSVPSSDGVANYMADAWYPVDQAEWISPVIGFLPGGRFPVATVATINLPTVSSVEIYYRGSYTKPPGTYTQKTTQDGYLIEYSTGATITSDWKSADQFASDSPNYFQVKLKFVI